MNVDDEYWLEILRHNKGFDEPGQWIEYARRENFRKVEATKITRCPDCRSDIYSPVGQYVYYSTLITLQQCKNCELVFSNTHINGDLISQHFGMAYKDEVYFSLQRKQIFSYIAQLADVNSPPKGKVLDIGED